MILIEISRLYLGYDGNLREKVSNLIRGKKIIIFLNVIYIFSTVNFVYSIVVYFV